MKVFRKIRKQLLLWRDMIRVKFGYSRKPLPAIKEEELTEIDAKEALRLIKEASEECDSYIRSQRRSVKIDIGLVAFTAAFLGIDIWQGRWLQATIQFVVMGAMLVMTMVALRTLLHLYEGRGELAGFKTFIKLTMPPEEREKV